jgi:sulfatase maturation enzyme AslB (radical SAM superfamily)
LGSTGYGCQRNSLGIPLTCGATGRSHAVRKLCQDRGIVYKPGMDTNGTLLGRSFLSEFHHLGMSLTLSNQEDHDKNRPYADGRGSFDTITENLVACRDVIGRKPGPTLSVRYNTHSRNYTSLGSFLETLTRLEVPISNVKAKYVDEYPQNSFSNGLTRDEFVSWNSTVCFDTLIEHGYRIGFFPATAVYPCKAYMPFNCKVFANGYVGLCDASPCAPGLTVLEIARDPNLVNSHFSHFKSWSPLQEPECARCTKLSTTR